MATNVAIDGLLDSMVTQLSANITAARSVQRYMGGEFQSAEGLKRGVAGRCPALRVRWAGSKTLRTTIGRRVDRVESTFNVIVASDDQRGRDSRKTTLAIAESVRNFIGSRAFGLSVTPARWQSTNTLRDADDLLALSVVFTVRHRVDYSISAGTDVMLDSKGSIVNAAVAHTSTPHGPTVTPQGAPGSTSWSYALVGIDSTGLRTLVSPIGTTTTGTGTLNGSNFNRLDWAAKAGIVTYEIERSAAGGVPNTTGVIGSTSLLTFNDTGLAVLGATPPDSLHVDLHDVFP